MWDYSDILKDHFFNPRNVGEIEDPDAEAEVGSLACGDALKLQLKIDEREQIADAKFQTFGCGSAIAAASALTEMIKGKTVDEAEEISNRDIAEYLGGIPEEKMHCSVMGQEALEGAIANYRGLAVEGHEEEEGRIVCRCFGVTEAKIRRVVAENNLRTVEQVTNYTKAAGGCGGCYEDIEDVIDEVWKEKGREKKPVEIRPELTNLQKIRLIQDIIEQEVRPALQADGGDVELIDVDGDKVYVAMRGACSNCLLSGYTVKEGIEVKLREQVVDTIEVEERTT